MHIVFWQPVSVIHNKYICALAEVAGIEVTLIAQESSSEEQKRIGIDVLEPSKVKVLIAPERKVIQSIINYKTEESIHIFSGRGVYPLVEYAFRFCKNKSLRIGCISEVFDDKGLRGPMRLVRSKIDVLINERYIDFMLLMGAPAIHWFRRAGWPIDKLYQFGYIIDDKDMLEKNNSFGEGNYGDTVELIFLGQCIKRKGLDILLKALKPVLGLNWFLTIVGEGCEKAKLLKLANDLGISGKIKFSQGLRHKDAMRVLAGKDLLVLPSRFDGWGAVVNEALMLGVPVICSDKCGAADLLEESWRGSIFKSESIAGLSRALEYWIKKGKKTKAETERIKAWSECISGKRAAEYILSVIDSSKNCLDKPQVPWVSRGEFR
ncbi:MAG: glycosyltransferase [Candidatus Omnitrophica bacterium]|nr:glycosyltransferase [Candidatus Omnitrophota bacterium]